MAYAQEIAYFGFNKQAQLIDINRLDKAKVVNVSKTVVSAIGVNTQKGIYGLGWYNKQVYLRDTRTHEYFCAIANQGNGCTQVEFDDNYMCVGTRNDTWIYYWDLRNDTRPVESFYRDAQTSQRMYFSYSGNKLCTGSLDGSIIVYDTLNMTVETNFPLMFDSVWSVDILDTNYQNCDSKNKDDRLGFLAIAGSGQRHYTDFESDSSDEDKVSKIDLSSGYQNGIRLFVT